MILFYLFDILFVFQSFINKIFIKRANFFVIIYKNNILIYINILN